MLLGSWGDLPTWGLTLPAWSWVPSLRAFLPGWEGALGGPALLPSWGGLGVLDQVIFPSFCSNLLNVLIYLALTFKYLDPLSISINSWHSNIEVVELMDASCDLHLSLWLALLSRRLFSSPSDLMKSSYGWMKASLSPTNVLFKRIYQLLLNDTTGWEIYTTMTFACTCIWENMFKFKC